MACSDLSLDTWRTRGLKFDTSGPRNHQKRLVRHVSDASHRLVRRRPFSLSSHVSPCRSDASLTCLTWSEASCRSRRFDSSLTRSRASWLLRRT